jgi:hypothetical protein
MKQIIAILALSATAFCAQAQQEVTFDRQLEQALTELNRFGTSVSQTVIVTNDMSAVTQDQLNAIAAVMSEKDGYIRLLRNSDSEFTVIHAAFVTTGDLLSVCRFAGTQFRLSNTAVHSTKAVFGE